MVKRIRESCMYAPVRRYLCGDYVVRKQVKIGSKIVDLFAASKTTGETVAIELKVENWQRALKQAATYQVFAQFSYVALHRSRVASALKHENWFRQLGVGLMSVRKDVQVHIPPCESTFVNRETDSRMRELLLGRVGKEIEALPVVQRTRQ